MIQAVPNRRSSNEKRRFLTFALLASLPLLMAQLLLPLSGDNEVYQSMAKELLEFHWMPYLGSWDNNFPGIIYYHWLSIVVVGNSSFAFHFFDSIVHLIMAWLLYSFLLRWLRPQVSFLTVVLYNLHYFAGMFDTSGQRDAIATFFLLAGTMLLYRVVDAQPSRRWAEALQSVAAGACFAAMFVIRVSNVSFIVIGIVFLISIRSKRGNLIAWYIVGAGIVTLATFLPYFFLKGGLEQIYLTFLFNLEIYGRIRYPLSFLLKELLIEKLFIIPAGVLLFIVPSFRRRIGFRGSSLLPTFHRRDVFLFSAYFFAALGPFLIMGKFWDAQLEPVLFLLMPLTAIGIDAVITALARPRYQYLAVAMILLYAIFRVAPRYPIQPFVAGTYSIANGLDIADTGFSARVDASLASYIDRTSPANSRFECASIMAGLRWRVARKSATRFTTFYPVGLATPEGNHPAFQQSWRREYVDSLRSARPFYLVLSSVSPTWVGPGLQSPGEIVQELPGFDSEILPHYQFDTVMGTYVILKRQD